MEISFLGLFSTFLILGLSNRGCYSQKIPSLIITPSPPVQMKAVGASTLLSCQPDVEKKDLITELMWKDPQNRIIDSNYINKQWITTEVMGANILALVIESFQDTLAGNYTCTANYANMKLSKTVRLESIYPIKFEDAPEIQNPIINTDYKVKCKVSANPAPHVDWSKNKELIKPSGRYIIEPDGLLIAKVKESDDGTYTCRATVLQTGELATKHIKVEVHTPPVIQAMNSSVEVIEGETASVICSAFGKPKPTFSWIKNDNNANVAKMSRFGVNELTGMMTISPVDEKDHGEYKCVASNAAANAERIIKILVKSKPKIAPIKNITVAVNQDVRLECFARGRPVPKISFRKYKSSNIMSIGRQPYDDRIFVDNKPGAEEGEVVGILLIQRIRRTDDGLYECIASNSAADSFMTGHITVEFAPSFANTPIKEAWTWDRKPINLTCLAESIPNATITWRLNGRDVDNDLHIRRNGNGPISTLLVTPIDARYYGTYVCMASNIHGSANHTIYLKEAFKPSQPLQVTPESITATTIRFKILGPQFDGGVPIRSYIAQFKQERQSWVDARNRTWAVGLPYVIENLVPREIYSFRFAAQNDVGIGHWSGEQIYTMPVRSPPAEPTILQTPNEEGIIISPFDTKLEIKWKIPADNGEPIDSYEIKYCPMSRNTYVKDGKCAPEIIVYKDEGTSYIIPGLRPDSYYRVELRAHNAIGYSAPVEGYFKTARGIDKDHLVATSQGFTLTSGAIVGIVVASLLVILLIVDVSCYFVNHAGVLYLLCGGKKKSADDDSKLTSLYGWRFPLPYCKHRTSASYTGSGAIHTGIDLEILPPPDSDLVLYEEKEPLKENGKPKIEMMDERLKRDTRITYDDKNSTVKTTFIGKDSSV